MRLSFKVILATFLIPILAACTPLKLLNAVTPHDNANRAVKNIAYGSLERQKLDIYSPSASGALAPVIVFFYGGNWNSGSRAEYAFVGQTLASRGIVTVVADYRLYPQVRYPAFLEDAALSVAWSLKEIKQYGGDPGRLFVMGHSAGAYNAAMVALDERWLGKHGIAPNALRGWIGLAGPYDFLPIENRDVQPVFFHPATPTSSQPINHVKPGAPPALLIAARKDTVVNPVRNTAGLAERLRSESVPVTEVYYDGVTHSTLVASLSASLRYLAPTLDLVESFVKPDNRARPLPASTISMQVND